MTSARGLCAFLEVRKVFSAPWRVGRVAELMRTIDMLDMRNGYELDELRAQILSDLGIKC